MEDSMNIIRIAVLSALLGTLALPALAQHKCPEGQHYDTAQQKCVPHGQ
jgi:hypothetical protein